MNKLWIGFVIGVVFVLTVHYVDVSFSSPSSEATVVNSSAAVRLSLEEYLPSQADIQYELNRRNPKAKLEVDGVCGRLTQYWWDLSYNQQCAMETWPK